MKRIFSKMILSLVMLTSATALFAADPVVIVNNSNKVSELTSTDLSLIYTGKKTTWDSGDKIQPVDQNLNSDVSGAFLKVYVKKSNGEYKSYWMSQMLSGAGTAPKALAGDAAVIDFVKNNPGAIGYVTTTELPDGVKQVVIK